MRRIHERVTNGWHARTCRFNSLGVNSIEDAYWFEDIGKLQDTIGGKVVPMWNVARQSLPSGLSGLEDLKTSLWNRLVNLDQQSIWNTWGKGMSGSYMDLLATHTCISDSSVLDVAF